MRGARDEEADDEVVALIPVLRRVVASRVRDPHSVEDLVQEALARVVAARSRVELDDLTPYAVTTARNLVARHARNTELARRKSHLLHEPDDSEEPAETVLRTEDQELVARALATLSPEERELLVAHELAGVGVRLLADNEDSTPGAVAAHLNRTRAKLRVEYLLAQEPADSVGEGCRPALQALSLGDRRRQRELDVTGHLLGCDLCSRLSGVLRERRRRPAEDSASTIAVEVDSDVVTARQRGRELALREGFGSTDATLIATAISEMARNVVKFADRGEVRIFPTREDGREGLTVVVRDRGPGIPDLDQAMRDGYSTYAGLGLGLPGTRRLMDRFEVVTATGEGTTVTMTKWRSDGARRRGSGDVRSAGERGDGG
jgi:RNA polymerase sigma factor (sigma-70 family)